MQYLNEKGRGHAASCAQAFAVVVQELNYQDAGLGNAARHTGADPTMSPAEYLTYMRQCMRDAEEAAYRGVTGAQDCLPFFRKIAALSVSCMMRHGAPERLEAGHAV